MSLLDTAGVVTGDIWCSGAFSFESPLKDLLDSGEYTLEQLLSEDELLQELRGVHPQLIEFFSTEEAVTGLVKYVTLPPNGTSPISTTIVNSIATSSSMVSESLTVNESDDEPKSTAEEAEQRHLETGPQEPTIQIQGELQDHSNPTHNSQSEKDALFVRFPYMSCEVICCEVKEVIDLLVDGYVPANMYNTGKGASASIVQAQEDPRRSILDLLFDMLYDAEAGEIDDYRAGYFDKILSVLFRKRPQALAEYINTGGRRGQAALITVMFKHLYSHSIMQIVQRLLLPQPPLPPTEGDEDDEDDKEGVKLYTDPLEGADIDGFGAFRCTWPDSDEAMKVLVDCLIDKSPYPEIEENEERRLSLYQNASEVLITIIQNSPLTSPRLHSLTTDPLLKRLIEAATTERDGESFGPHDSRQTCTMNVLESLILQLGGYGSVVTMMYPEEEEDLGDGEDGEEIQNPSKRSSGLDESLQPEMATSETLISHLPFMLSNLCHLLQYPDADNWRSPMQYSKKEHQNILGSSRLRIVRLLESLVLLGDPNVDARLCESNCLEACLDLFWKFQWCSMLHQSVANLLVHVFEGANTRAELQAYFLVKCNLLGRLMNSFWEETENINGSSIVAESENEIDKSPSSVHGENGSSVGEEVSAGSEDDGETDVDRTSDENGNSMDAVGRHPEHTPPQSFRLGYMGHVIIICQALVHACSNEGMEPSLGETNDPETNGDPGEYAARHNEGGEPHYEEGQDLGPKTSGSVATDDMPANPLILAQLVETHALKRQWEEFVQSTLASETAIQSTPLGGFPGGGMGDMDQLQSHRPGLAEDDEYDDDDGAAPPLPPRGLLVGGDVIDMDDNDLDVAASMMAGLSMGRGTGSGRSDKDLLSGIPQQTGDGARSGYMFEDPLGDGRFGRFDGDDSDDSSDEESEVSGKSGDSGGAVAEGVSGSTDNSAEAPVMDLFAGNFEAFDSEGESTPDTRDRGEWSDFANFDNAFEGTNGSSTDIDDPFNEDPKEKKNISEIFGESKGHSELLEGIDDPVADAFASASPTQQ